MSHNTALFIGQNGEIVLFGAENVSGVTAPAVQAYHLGMSPFTHDDDGVSRLVLFADDLLRPPHKFAGAVHRFDAPRRAFVKNRLRRPVRTDNQRRPVGNRRQRFNRDDSPLRDRIHHFAVMNDLPENIRVFGLDRKGRIHGLLYAAAKTAAFRH